MGNGPTASYCFRLFACLLVDEFVTLLIIFKVYSEVIPNEKLVFSNSFSVYMLCSNCNCYYMKFTSQNLSI